MMIRHGPLIVAFFSLRPQGEEVDKWDLKLMMTSFQERKKQNPSIFLPPFPVKTIHAFPFVDHSTVWWR